MREYFIAITFSKKTEKEIVAFRERFLGNWNPTSPPHMTIVPPFTLQVPEPKFLNKLSEVSSEISLNNVLIKKLSYFGIKQARVIFMEPSIKDLSKIHKVKIAISKDVGKDIRPASIPLKFHPHITLKRLAINQNEQFEKAKRQFKPFTLDKMYLTLFSKTACSHWKGISTYTTT